MTKIIVPDIGDFEEVEIIDVLVKEGDSVDIDAGILLLETDKASMEIPAGITGRVSKLLVKIGDKVSQGDNIAELDKIEQAKNQKDNEVVIDNNPVNNTGVTAESVKIEDLKLPDLGADGSFNVIEVLVKSGDVVENEQTLLVLESDKASMEVPAEFSGKITEFNVKVGDDLASYAIIGKIETKLEQTTSAKTIASTYDSKETNISPSTNISNSNNTINDDVNTTDMFAGPATRRLAKALKVQSSDIAKGRGRGGRIVRDDILEYVAKKLENANSGSKVASALSEIDHSKFGEIEVEKRSRIQQMSAQNLQKYWVNIPHVTIFEDCDITDLENFRQAQKDAYKEKGVRLTMLAFIIKVAAKALIMHPKFNASINNNCDELTLKNYYNIGVAVDTPNGLVVPVVNDADKKSISTIAQDLLDLSKKARDSKLPSSAYKGHTFTISSLGGIGSTGFTPIVNHPDVAILGVSKSTIKPVYKDGKFEPRLIAPLALSFDHRAIDGAAAAKFMLTLKQLLEDIKTIIL